MVTNHSDTADTVGSAHAAGAVGTAEIRRHGAEAIPRLEPLWNALFDHHVSIGAAGIPTIPREESWPRRQMHYQSLFAHEPNAAVWIAELAGDPVGYALAFEEALRGERALLLETLSVLPSARGLGIGSRLMELVDDAARSAGISIGLVDVMNGNARARELYLKRGFAPHSEFWMRSTQPETSPSGAVDLPRIAAAAQHLGFTFSTSPGLDDTWVSAEDIADLNASGSTTWVTANVTAKLTGHTAELEDLDVTALRTLFGQLEAAGLWTIRLEILAAPEAGNVREALRTDRFRMSTERLARSL